MAAAGLGFGPIDNRSVERSARLVAVPGINYNTARIELPARASGTMPVLQQYDVSGVQRLMLFSVLAP